MIESLNNIIFWIGYSFVFSIFLYLGIVFYIKSYELLMNKKWFFNYIFDSALINSLKKTNDENFEKWIEKIRFEYKNIKRKSK